MARRFYAIVAGLCVLLGGCVSAPVGPADLAPLEAALSAPVSSLRARAETGDANSQYAMSILLTHGKRGVPQDLDQARVLRVRAMAPRGFTSITTYVAGLRGKPGRVMVVQVPRYDLSPGQAARIDQCVDVLTRLRRSRPADEACGGAATHELLETLWNDGRPTPVRDRRKIDI